VELLVLYNIVLRLPLFTVYMYSSFSIFKERKFLKAFLFEMNFTLLTPSNFLFLSSHFLEEINNEEI